MKQTIIGDTVFSAFLMFCSLILSLSSTFFVYKVMHIIYNFKAFEKGFQINVNASRNISNTFQSTLKKEWRHQLVHFVRMSENTTSYNTPFFKFCVNSMFNIPFERVSRDQINGMIVIYPTVTIIIQ
jgi:hypothetical protein